MEPTDEDRLAELDLWADWLDARFRLPGTGIRFGIDGLIGLVPVVGDTLALLFSVVLLGRLWQLGMPGHVKIVMVWNLLFDYLIGLLPIIGDLFDIGFKANLRNVRLARRVIARRSRG